MLWYFAGCSMDLTSVLDNLVGFHVFNGGVGEFRGFSKLFSAVAVNSMGFR